MIDKCKNTVVHQEAVHTIPTALDLDPVLPLHQKMTSCLVSSIVPVSVHDYNIGLH